MADKRSCRLMFYFSENAPDLSQINLEQLTRVQKFREKLKALGGLYWTYRDVTELRTDLRRHLHFVVDEFLSGSWGQTSVDENEFPVPTRKSQTRETKDDEHSGFRTQEIIVAGKKLIETLMTLTRPMSPTTTIIDLFIADALQRGSLTQTTRDNLVESARAELTDFGVELPEVSESIRECWSDYKAAVYIPLVLKSIRSEADFNQLSAIAESMNNVGAAVGRVGQGIVKMGKGLDLLVVADDRLTRDALMAKSRLQTILTQWDHMQTDTKEFVQLAEAKMGQWTSERFGMV
ncbi:MAG: hypothetical protein WBW04_03745 [Nitrolancea sp.]